VGGYSAADWVVGVACDLVSCLVRFFDGYCERFSSNGISEAPWGRAQGTLRVEARIVSQDINSRWPFGPTLGWFEQLLRGPYSRFDIDVFSPRDFDESTEDLLLQTRQDQSMADRFSPPKSPSLGRINTPGLISSGDRLDAPFREDVNRKTHRRRPCPGSPNLKAAREKQPRQKPRSPIALRCFQRAPGTGKLLAHYSNGPPWKAQLLTVLPHSGRWLPGLFHMRRGLGTIHSNQIQETIFPASHIASQQISTPTTLQREFARFPQKRRRSGKRRRGTFGKA
jgi:hypothetical protein